MITRSWAVSEIDKGNESVKEFLKETFSKASPMWRQSHYYLHDMYGWK